MKTCKFILSAALLILMSLPVTSQNHWQARFRPGLDFPIGEYEGNEVNTGYGFDVNLAYIVLPYLSAYVGWDWKLFKADGFDGVEDVEINEKGYSLGFRYIHPLKNAISYLFGVGAVYKHLEIDQSTNGNIGDTGHKWGWQGEAGLSIDLGSRLYLQPGLQYQSVSFNDTFSYFSLGLALSKTF